MSLPHKKLLNSFPIYLQDMQTNTMNKINNKNTDVNSTLHVNSIKENATPNNTLSVSNVCEFLYCPRKLFLTKILGLKEIEKQELVLGELQHKFYEIINYEDEKIIKKITGDIELSKLKRAFRLHYSQVLRQLIISKRTTLSKFSHSLIDVLNHNWHLVITESEKKALNTYNFIKKHNIYGDELWTKLTPKIKSEIKIKSDKLNIKGVIDRIMIYPDKIEVIEIKTGAPPSQGIWDSHRMQTALYLLMLKENLYNKNNSFINHINNIGIINNTEHLKVEGYVLYSNTQQLTPVIINPFLEDEIYELIRKTRELINSKLIPHKLNNENKCNRCSLQDKCNNNELITSLMQHKSP